MTSVPLALLVPVVLSAPGLSVQITDTGQATAFESPPGYVHLKHEGYVLCYQRGSTSVNAFSVGHYERGFGAPSSAASPARVTRTTVDGALRLEQLYTID